MPPTAHTESLGTSAIPRARASARWPPVRLSEVSAFALGERSARLVEPSQTSLLPAWAGTAAERTPRRMSDVRMSGALVEEVGGQEALEHDRLLAGRGRRRDDRRVAER